MVITQGAQANLNGRVFEKMLILIFEANKFKIFPESEVNKKPNLLKGLTRCVLKNVSYITIYGERGKTEFVIIDNSLKVRVEAKYQVSQGSVDEKYPYMLLNGIYQYPEKEIIFIVDGGGYKHGARKWLKKYIENNWLDYKIIRQRHKVDDYN